MTAQYVQELEVYQRAFELQQAIFDHSKSWPKEEAYALVGQIRRSSRGVSANISQAWGRRSRAALFAGKLIDAEGDLSETRHWLRTATACKYIDSTAALAISRMTDVVSHLLSQLMQAQDGAAASRDVPPCERLAS